MTYGQTTLKALAVLVTISGLAVMVAWYGFLEPSWLSYPNGTRFEVETEIVAAGDPVMLKVRPCSSADEEEAYMIAVRMVRLDPPPGPPPRPIIIPSGGLVPIDPGCFDEVSASSIVPPQTPPGTYSLRGLSRVEGRWKSTTIPWSSAPFRVVAPPHGVTLP